MTATATKRPSAKTTSKGSASREAANRPSLRVVDKRAIQRRAARRVLLSVAGAVVASGVFAVAMVYAQLARGQQYLDDVREQSNQAEAELARLERDVVLASSPDSVVARALALGMVRAQNPVYLTASSDPADSADAGQRAGLSDLPPSSTGGS